MYHRYARQEEPGGPELEEMVPGDLLPDVAAGAEIKQMMELTEVAATHRHKDKGSRVAELYRQIQVLSKLSILDFLYLDTALSVCCCCRVRAGPCLEARRRRRPRLP